ncbi:D-alanyl-D-alanine carboxypeptidase [Dissulfurispira thermophila]|uniref:D-alanyl-D-alanine carboxypeptidase n=2 Tax=root TaxID=1 RepID=A0A7G1GZD6_9BACT|nr:D-alanyl-D-alanine carboxypeptidase family protein [Dissulfurispira thermophila]BCB95855.1 D-alanyl-D-alanine carboxypeptidase [Dissulfurispira thermophila]
MKLRSRLNFGQRAVGIIFGALFFSISLNIGLSFAHEISARAAVVIDSASEKILYAKNPSLKQPPASTTKLVTAIVVLDKLHPDHIVTISEKAAGTPSISPHLRSGERFSVRDLLYLALMRSVNSAAVALAEAVAGSEEEFVYMMNDRVSRLGAENTKFINASGLPGHDQYITAFDLAKIMKESLKYPLIREIITTRAKEVFSEAGRKIFIKNTNQLLWTDDDNLGGKTGYTRAARHCFVCAVKKEHNTLIAAILGESARDNLWDDSEVLLSKGYDVLTQKAEPMIYISSESERPVVFASYKTDGKNKKVKAFARGHKYKAKKVAHINSKKGSKKIVKKKMRSSNKELSVRRSETFDKS